MATQGVYDIFNDEGDDIDGAQIILRQYCATEFRKEIDLKYPTMVSLRFSSSFESRPCSSI